MSALTIGAQTASVDLSFNAVPSNALPTDINFQQVIQPDGKILIYNAPSMFIGGEFRSGMFRLNPDGSLDSTFTYDSAASGMSIERVLVAPDGKIVVGGTGAPNHGKMIRLNSDGSFDSSFSVFITAVGPPEFTGNVIRLQAIQPDGKVIATHTSWGNIQGTWYSHTMRRYNLDASIDSSFVSPALEGGHLMYTTPLIELLPDGRFYLALTSRSHLGGFLNITRRLATGAVDPGYTAYQVSIQPSGFLSIEDISVASDGGVLATGVLQQTAIGFPPVQQLRKFLPDGSLAPGFTSPLVMSATAVHQLPDGKILYSASGGTVTRPLIRLNTDGSVDNTYVLDPAVTGIVNRFSVDSMNRPIFLAQTAAGRVMLRLQENGAVDPTFSVSMGTPGTVNIVATQQDGKLLVAGTYAYMNGVTRSRISRVNSDGSLDTTFDPGTGLNNFARQLAIQPDGKIIVVGAFASYNGVTTGPMLRLNPNGSLDTSFSVPITGPTVESVALQADGKILIGGNFTQVGGSNRTGIARLDSTGALDTTFNPVLGGTAFLKAVVVESNGKIVIGGNFTGVNGDARNNMARLESSGATDLAFNATISTVSGLHPQSDGKYLATTNNFAQLTRRNADGSTDGTFTSPTIGYSSTPFVITALQLPDSSILIGGRFDTVNGVARRNFTRLRSNGSLLTSFMPNGASGDVHALHASANGKIMIGGAFTSVDTASRVGVARLNVPALQSRTRFDFDGDGRAEVTVYRPSSGIWYQLFLNGAPYGSPTFGLAGDVPTPADFDGDGKTDLAIYRPSNGQWWYRLSSNNALQAADLGHHAEDKPLPSDVDGDGLDDFVVFRPSESKWYWTTRTGQNGSVVFGIPGDIPVIGDFDGDGKSDRAVFRPSTGDWWYAASASGGAQVQFHCGANGDIPVPADYDGDGKTDMGVFRPSDGGWYIFRSGDFGWITQGYGLAGDRPVPADYDGDGRADFAVFRPSTGIWYLLQSTSGSGGVNWGLASDIAIPNAFTAQ